MEFEYQDRITVFIDLMGFKAMVFGSEADQRKLNVISDALAFLKSWEQPNSWDLSFVEIQESAQYKGVEHFDVSCNLSCTCFSDSIVVSVAASLPNINFALSTLISHLAFIGAHLISSGILFRGGISYGQLAHINNEIVIGRALIEAHELESKMATYPRIILTEKLLKKLNYPIETKSRSFPYHQYLKRYDDGCVGFSQLSFFQVMQSTNGMDKEIFLKHFFRSRETIIKGLNSNFNSPRIFKKYTWLMQEYERTIILEDGIKETIRPISAQDIHYK